jgi:hypothetical protein
LVGEKLLIKMCFGTSGIKIHGHDSVDDLLNYCELYSRGYEVGEDVYFDSSNVKSLCQMAGISTEGVFSQSISPEGMRDILSRIKERRIPLEGKCGEIELPENGIFGTVIRLDDFRD